MLLFFMDLLLESFNRLTHFYLSLCIKDRQALNNSQVVLLNILFLLLKRLDFQLQLLNFCLLLLPHFIHHDVIKRRDSRRRQSFRNLVNPPHNQPELVPLLKVNPLRILLHLLDLLLRNLTVTRTVLEEGGQIRVIAEQGVALPHDGREIAELAQHGAVGIHSSFHN